MAERGVGAPIGWVREIVLDTTRPLELSQFWARLLGGTPTECYDGWITLEPPPHGQRLSFQRTESLNVLDDAVHFDVLVEDLEASHEVVVAHGGTFLHEHWSPRTGPDGGPFRGASTPTPMDTGFASSSARGVGVHLPAVLTRRRHLSELFLQPPPNKGKLGRSCQWSVLESTHEQDRPYLAEEQLLDAVDAVHQRHIENGVELLRLVQAFADQHGPRTVDPDKAQLRGRQQAIRLGGEGTPLVAEFAPAVLAARLGLSAQAGARLVADALDLRYRLPYHWAGVQAHQISQQHARYVAAKTRQLSVEEAAYVDERIADSADGRLSWTRFEDLVATAIVAADPAGAVAREREAERNVFAKATRSTEHGMRGFYVRATAPRSPASTPPSRSSPTPFSPSATTPRWTTGAPKPS